MRTRLMFARSLQSLKWIQGVIAAGLLTAVLTQPVHAEYRLQAGDMIELAVTGVPDIRQRSAVSLDGEVTIPLLGQIKAAGLTMAELRAIILRDLPNKVYHQRTPDGREIGHVIAPEEIGISIAEYRPVYVAGDVVRPGEQPFKSGMTVRQAVSVAGGYDVMRFRMNNPVMETADLKAEFMGLWTEYAKVQAQIWRIRSELGEKVAPDAVTTAPISPAVTQQFLENEKEQWKARASDRDKEQAHLRDAIKKASQQLDTLAEKKRKDEEGNAADLADFDKIRDFFQKGSTVNVRLSEARRSALLSSTQLLQTIVEITNLERQRNDYMRQLERVDDQRRLEGLRELQDARLRAKQLQSRIDSVSEKLLYTSALQSQLIKGLSGRPEFVVYREGPEGRNRLEATDDLALAPGDVVEVALRMESLLGNLPVR